MEKAEKVHFLVAIVLFDMEMQSVSILINFKNLRSFRDFGQRSLARNIFTFYKKPLGLITIPTTILALLLHVCKRSGSS